MHLDIKHNKLKTIKKECFVTVTKLKTAEISYNQINHIEAGSFVNLNSLIFIYISNNLPVTISLDTFTSLQILSIYNNPQTDLDIEVFQKLHVDIIETFNYYICCIVTPRIMCNAKKQ